MKFPIIQSLWIGKLLSNLEKLCIQSFLDHRHEFHLYTYADIGGIPSGATVKDCNESMGKVVTDKDAQFDAESLFEQLKAKHNIRTNPNARRITAEELHAAMIDKRLYKFERRDAKRRKIVVALLAAIAALVSIGIVVL